MRWNQVETLAYLSKLHRNHASYWRKVAKNEKEARISDALARKCEDKLREYASNSEVR